jgi:hypothetical protein
MYRERRQRHSCNSSYFRRRNRIVAPIEVEHPVAYDHQELPDAGLGDPGEFVVEIPEDELHVDQEISDDSSTVGGMF